VKQRVSELKIDRKKFKEVADRHSNGFVHYYINDKDGIMYEFQLWQVDYVEYYPPSKYDNLQCNKSISNKKAEKAASPENVSATPDSITQSPSPISYKAISSTRSSLEHNKLIVLISTSPENFVRDRMLMLAHKLNQDFGSEPRVYAVLFDSEESAQYYNPAGGSYYVSKKLERGEYTLDRVKGTERITFSSERGKPANEIKITLDRPHLG
jgi:hypothetical protein